MGFKKRVIKEMTWQLQNGHEPACGLRLQEVCDQLYKDNTVSGCENIFIFVNTNFFLIIWRGNPQSSLVFFLMKNVDKMLVKVKCFFLVITKNLL